MKNRYIIFMVAILIGLSACVEDKGSNSLKPINEITFSGIEDEYNKVSYAETLIITPEIEMSLNQIDESKLVYHWFLCDNSTINEQHITIGTQKNLDYPLDIPPGTYRLFFQVLDKTTGLKWEKMTTLKTLSQFVHGFYLFGDKEDGTCGMDFISMITGKDTVVVEDIFTNSLGIKEAKNLIFTGAYRSATALWAITNSGSYSIEYSSSQSEFDIRTDVSTDKIFFPTIEVTRPLKVMDIHPHAFGKSNAIKSNSNRLLKTENEFFISNIIQEEAYGNPKNRYSASAPELFKPSPYLFYLENGAYMSRIVFFDETNLCFVGLNTSYSTATYCSKYKTDEASPFYFDQKKYTPERTLVYGENGYGNAGQSYALMTNSNGEFFIYSFLTSTLTPTKNYGGQVDPSVASNFAQSSHYAFFSMQAIILYSVGSQLWAYDYNRKEAKMIKDFGSEITFLAMDYHSNDTPTDFIVATYSPSEKGTVRKFTIADDQNNITVTAHEKEVWKTNLKVVKVEYRNASI